MGVEEPVQVAITDPAPIERATWKPTATRVYSSTTLSSCGPSRSLTSISTSKRAAGRSSGSLDAEGEAGFRPETSASTSRLDSPGLVAGSVIRATQRIRRRGWISTKPSSRSSRTRSVSPRDSTASPVATWAPAPSPRSLRTKGALDTPAQSDGYVRCVEPRPWPSLNPRGAWKGSSTAPAKSCPCLMGRWEPPEAPHGDRKLWPSLVARIGPSHDGSFP